ncbi:MAG: aldehyde dehydrogenase family protein [Alphaproteobacteria bacterium]|nr:aldehyde dehydrogenase family protein [Alphaproteobacteria bacterium]
MENCLKFYIDGQWVDPVDPKPFDVINPANEQVIGQIMMGNEEDVNKAVAAAKKAFASYSRFTVQERLELLDAIIGAYQNRFDEVAKTISAEMGAPIWLSKAAQAAMGIAHLTTARGILEKYEFQKEENGTLIAKEPVGVCGLITPWNWPVNQIACKVAPALAAGCTMVLKIGADPARNRHTRRIILDDADFNKAVAQGVQSCFMNSGQSCNAPTRMLVPASRHDEVVEIAKAAAAKVTVGDPMTEGTTIGPVVSEMQFEKVQGLIEKAIEEGTELVAGGPGKPDGLNAGYYCKPTIFANVTNDMTIAREEVFGPVLSILKYETEEQAIEIANDTVYGLSGYVQSGDIDHARNVASQLRTGNVHLNGAGPDLMAPFGGYKQSGNGREWGPHGFEDFLETKAVLGYAAE